MPLPGCARQHPESKACTIRTQAAGSFQATNCQELLELRQCHSAVVRIRVDRRLAINASAAGPGRCSACVCCRLSPRLCKAWRRTQSLVTFQHLRAEILSKTVYCHSETNRLPKHATIETCIPLLDCRSQNRQRDPMATATSASAKLTLSNRAEPCDPRIR